MANNKLPCKFYASGNCKFGNNCKFAHVNNNNNSNSGQNNASVLEKFVSPNTLYDKTSQIKQDLSDYKLLQSNPVLSSYGLGFPAVNNLIPGRDLSYEEVRLQYLEAVASNSISEYERNIEARRKDMDYCIDHLRGQEQHAARYQQKSAEPNVGPAKSFIPLSLEENIAQFSNPGNNAFGSANNQSNPFGATTFGNASSSGAFGAQLNPFESKPNIGSGFGNSGFGNSNTNNQSAFGGGATAGAFGKPASTTTSAFGAPSTGTAFGSTGFGSAQPAASSGSAFGSSGFGNTKPAATTSAFGAPSTGSAFGSTGFGSAQPTTSSGSAFGSSGFGNSKPAATASAFGAPSTGTAFGSTGFGNPPSGSGFGSSGFGSASTSSGSAPGTSGFGQSGFGQSANNTTNLPFGNLNNDNKASPFGSTNNNNSTSAFGAGGLRAGLTGSNPFGSSEGKGASPFGTMTSQNTTLAFASSANTNLAFGQSSSNGNAFGASNNTPQQFGSGSNGSGFSNNSVPLGQSGFGSSSNDTSLDEYDPKVLEAFSAAKFELGKIPEVPPPLTLCQ